MSRRIPTTTALGLSLLMAACVQAPTDFSLTEVGIKNSPKPKASTATPGKPGPKASTPTNMPSAPVASALPPAPTNLSDDHKQLKPVVEAGLLAIAQVGFLQARSAIVGNNGSSLIGKIRLPGVISNNASSVIGNNGSSFRLAQAGETIATAAEAGEVLLADRHWPDGTATRQFTKDVQRPNDYIRRIEFGADGKPRYQFKQVVVETYAVSLRPRVVEKSTIANYDDGQFRAAYHYTESYDAAGRIAKLTFKKGNFREPFVALGMDIEEFTVDLATGRGTFRYHYSHLKKKEKGVLVDVKLNGQGKLDIDYNDPLAFFDGLSEVEDEKGKRLYTKRKKKGGGKSTRKFELDAGLELVYEQEDGRQLKGVLTKDGKVEGQTTQETREDGTVISTVTFPEDPDRPLVVGFGLTDDASPTPTPTTPPALPTVTTLAGSEAGFADGAGTAARFSNLRAIARSRMNPNRFYLADGGNHRIRVLTLTGTQAQVSTLAGDGTAGFADGLGKAARFNAPFGLAVGADDTLYVSEEFGHRIRKIAPDGTVTTLAGTGKLGAADGDGAAATFKQPAGLALDGANGLFVADFSNHRIRRIDLGSPTFAVTTFAGSARGHAEGQGTAAQFNGPLGLAFDAGQLFVADSGNLRLRKVTAQGLVSTYAGSGDPTHPFIDGPALTGGLNPPFAVAIGSGELLTAHNDLRTVSADGRLRTLAGQTASGYVDGSAKDAAFGNMFGIAVGDQGQVLVTDGSRVRLVRKP